MASAAFCAGDFGWDRAAVTRDLADLAGQLRAALQAMSGGRERSGPEGRGPRSEHGGREHGGKWERGGPWEREYPRRGRGHWGGGFGGQWGEWWPGPPGGPDPGRMPKAGRGDVRAAILALLREGPRNGYQIMSEISERSGGAWRPSPGAVYPALSQLADEGLIEGEESGGRRTFSLTGPGREYIEQHPESARGAWESTAQQEAWQLPALFSEAARLGGGIVQVAKAGSPQQVRAAEQLLAETRRKLYRILAEDGGDEDEDDQDEQED